MQTAQASKRQRRPKRGRPVLPDEQRRKFTLRVGLTEREFEAFQKLTAAECLTDESVLLRKIILERLKAGGLLTD